MMRPYYHFPTQPTAAMVDHCLRLGHWTNERDLRRDWSVIADALHYGGGVPSFHPDNHPASPSSNRRITREDDHGQGSRSRTG